MTNSEKQDICHIDPLTVRIRSPSLNETLAVTVASDSTVRSLKRRIQSIHPQRPSANDQRIIYGGKLLEDAGVIKDILQKADINTIPTFHLVVKPSGSTPAKIVNNIPLPTPSLQSQQQPVLPAQTQAQPQLQPQLQPQQQIPSFSQPTAAASYSALLPGGYQVVAINGQYFLAPVLVPAYNPPSFQSHPTSTSQDTHYQPQQQQHNPAPAAAPGANRPRNEAQRAASVWLAMKLVVILFIICQGASIHRIVFFHIAAFFFFLYQTGRLRVVVRHVRMEELNNLGNESVRATVPPPTPPPTANTDIHTRNDTSNNTQRDSSQQSSTAPPAPPATAAVPGAPTTFLEALKRGAYTFLASLWPNYGHDPRIAQAFENGQQEGLEGF